MAKLGILVLVLIAWLAIYLGRAVGVGVASFRSGYNEAQSVTKQVAVEELILRSCITAHMLGHDAREAAEMSVARPLTEEEWESRRAIWEHVFNLVKRDRDSVLRGTPNHG